MEDFNQDNQKTDAAYSTLNQKIDANYAALNQKANAIAAANPCVRLFEMTTTSDASTLEINLSGVDLSNLIELTLYICDTTDAEFESLVHINGLTGDVYETASFGNTQQDHWGYLRTTTCALHIGFGCSYPHAEMPTATQFYMSRLAQNMRSGAIHSLDMTKNNYQTYKAGTKVMLVGVRF